MLANSLDFKRAIAQQFDPDTDYSQFDEAEIDGAFEATVYQLLMERQHPISSTRSLDFGSIIHQVIKWNNFDIGLEYRPGEVRFPGRRNSRKLRSGYGHIRGYRDNTGEAPDVYLAPAFFDGGRPSDRLFKVDQLSPEDGDYDEPKYMAGFDLEEEAKSAYLREMPPDYFGGIKEVDLNELSQYRKSSPQDFSEQLSDIKETLSEFFTLIPPSPNFSEEAITKVVEEAIAPHIQRLDSLLAKLEFGEPIQIEGEILEDEEFAQIASTDPKDIQVAVDDWEDKVSDNVKNLIGAEDGDR
ncbi:hypothetical protein [Nostoc sp.]|uniref:hypothetical protein n=1 Tax=Nostoc sp. TaxID=1180 RepID=UPI002FFAEF84